MLCSLSVFAVLQVEEVTGWGLSAALEALEPDEDRLLWLLAGGFKVDLALAGDLGFVLAATGDFVLVLSFYWSLNTGPCSFCLKWFTTFGVCR